MNRELISSKQAIAILFLFVEGSSIVMGESTRAKQDSWISSLIAILAVLPIVLIYARIIRLYPGKGLFDIISIVFGNIGGKIVAVLYTWYALHLGSLVLRDFGEFIESVTMPDMPQLLIYLLMISLSVYAVRSGIETFGRSALIFAPIMIFLLLFTIVFSFSDFDFSNLQPVFGQGAKEILGSAFTDITFPFAETVLFISISSGLRPHDSPYKMYSLGIIIGGTILALGTLRNILVLGFPLVNDCYFPSYAAAKMIIIGKGDTVSRVEGSISAVFILSGYVKASICLFAASKGLAKIFSIENYRQMVIPAALIMVALAGILYSSIMEMFDFIDVYKYYVLPFQVILPIIIWIFAEIKKAKKPAVK